VLIINNLQKRFLLRKKLKNFNLFLDNQFDICLKNKISFSKTKKDKKFQDTRGLK
jgi:hypothetical protein